MAGWRFLPNRPVTVWDARLAQPFVPLCAATTHSSLATLTCAFVALGFALRLVRFSQNYPLWSDECFLAVNFIRRGYFELLRPLDNGQIAPPLYLWAERLVLDLAGFSEWTLRLFPLLCGLCSLILFWRIAARIMGTASVSTLMAVGIFAVSIHPIRHSADAKPYASDLLVALILLDPAVYWLGRRDAVGALWVLVGLAPLGVLLSNPAIFVAGGIGLSLLGPAWKERRWSPQLAVVAFALVVVGTASLTYLTFGRDQNAAAIEGLRRYWSSSFPPVGNPPRLAAWLLSVHTGSAFAYPGGGARGASSATALAFLIGAIAMARRGDRATLGCLLAPFGLAFLAAAFHLYPYGTEARLMQFAAPSICLLAGLGAATSIASIRDSHRRRAVVGFVIAALIGCGVLSQVSSSLHPYRMLHDRQERDFARRFWVEESGRGPLACAVLDFQIDPAGTWRGRKAWYLCNQMIYSPQRRSGRLRPFDPRLGHEPFRCVLFGDSIDAPRVRDWLARMGRSYRLRDVDACELQVTVGEGESFTEHWRILEFVPHEVNPRPAFAGNGVDGRRSL